MRLRAAHTFAGFAALAAFACAHDASPDDGAPQEVDLSATALALDPYPFKCGVALVESFETAAAASAWHASTWASATLDPSGNPLPVAQTSAGATQGKSALSAGVRFTGNGYEQGYVGREGLSLALSGCATLAFDVTLPASAPAGLRGALILLLGADGAWNGQNDPIALAPGATTTVRLALAGGISPPPARDLFKKLVGVGLKIDGMNIAWSGQIALDNLRVEALSGPTAADTNAYSVGTFGGFRDQNGQGAQSQTRNGFLTFTADSTVQGHALLWPKLGAGGGDFSLGAAYFGSTLPAFSAANLAFIDWVTLEASQSLPTGGSATATMSRAFPAVRYASDASSFTWVTASSSRAPMSRLAVVHNGQITVHPLDGGGTIDLSDMSEPWALLYAGDASGWWFDAPLLLTFEHRPAQARSSSSGVEFDFNGAMGRAQVMPLTGLLRRANSDTAAWDAGLPGDVVAQARSWVQPLAAFPTGMSESYTINESTQTVSITDHYTFDSYQDDWGTQPAPAAALPPAVYWAGKNGYPVKYGSAPVETAAATWYGPFAYQSNQATYTIPLAEGLTRLPIALRVLKNTDAATIRTELERVITDEMPSDPGTFWNNNDLADADALCDSWQTIAAGGAAREKARVAGPRLAENVFTSNSIGYYLEPVTGQQYVAPTYYPEANLPFDKEWNTGRQLAGLARCAESIDLDIARGAWPKILGTYRYHRIFHDWVTGSVLSSTLGINQLADGMNFAFDGQLGVGRLARKLGDEGTWRDVAYRASRQQLALYDAWFQSAFTQSIDYGIGHISNAWIPANELETRGAIDGWVEEFGLATEEFISFWETTNFLYYDLPVQFKLYRDYGLEARVKNLEYTLMPQFHPSWFDGNAMDNVDQRYYGSNYTSAHLVTRALLFHDDPKSLYGLYTATQGTQASNQWYTMHFHGMSGPMLLALERGKAPVLEAPVAAVRVNSATWDSSTGKIALDYTALRTGSTSFRTRKPGAAYKSTAASVTAGKRYTQTLTP